MEQCTGEPIMLYFKFGPLKREREFLVEHNHPLVYANKQVEINAWMYTGNEMMPIICMGAMEGSLSMTLIRVWMDNNMCERKSEKANQ